MSVALVHHEHLPLGQVSILTALFDTREFSITVELVAMDNEVKQG
jgi:hypothetical protein